MTFVEFLRVRGALKVTAIVMAALIAVLVIVRLTVVNMGGHDIFHIVEINGKDLSTFEKTARTTTTVLPDGTPRTISEDPAGNVRITTDDHGYWGGKHVEIWERNPPAGMEANHQVAMGDLTFERRPVNGGSLITIDNTKPEDLGYYFAIATLVALIVATILGAPFARENENHLEYTLTKPIGRVPLALGTIGVDLAGIVAAWILAVICMIVAHTILEPPRFVYGAYDTSAIVLGLSGCLAWYALLCAATASMKRGWGLVLGLSWPVAFLIRTLARAQLGDTAVGQSVHAIASFLAIFDPFNYLHFGPGITVNGAPQGALAGMVLNIELPALLVLAFIYGALAIFQWRRVEA